MHRTISVMVNANGVVDDTGKVRQSLHMFEFESETQLDEWLASAPVKQVMYDNAGPITQVELPRMNRRKE